MNSTSINSGAKSSSRVKEQRRVMDEASRQRRARKKLESLEQDNFHDDPHADLVMSKKALSLFQDGGGGGSSSKSREKTKHFAKTFHNCWKKTPFNRMILQITCRLKLQCQRSQNGIYAQFVVIFQILTVQAVG